MPCRRRFVSFDLADVAGRLASSLTRQAVAPMVRLGLLSVARISSITAFLFNKGELMSSLLLMIVCSAAATVGQSATTRARMSLEIASCCW